MAATESPAGVAATSGQGESVSMQENNNTPSVLVQGKNSPRNGRIVQFDSRRIVEELKNSLPDILSCTDLKKESANSFAGPCIKCGGTDRFVYKTDSGKCWCRQCHHESMDVIDFHAWLAGQSTTDFLKEKIPKSQPALRESPPAPDPGINPDIQAQWDELLKTHTNEKPVFDLFKRRGLSDVAIRTIYNDGLARFKKHAGAVSVGVPYSTLQGDVLAIQCLTVDGQPYSFTVENKKPANKVLMKGSAIGQDCFFICGADINTAKQIIIAESVINALTALECFPDACCMALGGSTFTNKVKALKPYAQRVEKVIVLVDNDDASEKMLRAIWDILVHKVFAFRWNADDPKGYDINDALMAGKRDRVIDLIQGAGQVWYTPDDDQQPPASGPDEPAARSFKLVKLSDIEEKAPQYLICPLLEIDSTGEIFSPPGQGKTFMLIDIAGCVASGKDFHGLSVRQGPVVYIAGEGQNGIKRRFTAWGIRHGVDMTTLPIFISMMPAGLCDADQVNYVIQAIQSVADEYGNPVLIVLDTVARNFGPGDENSTKDMGMFIAGLDAIRGKFGACVLLAHHSGHADQSRARGAMALKGALDAEYRIEMDETRVIRMTCTKIKDSEPPPPMSFRLNTVELPFQDDEGRPVTSAILDDVEYMPPPVNGKKGCGKWQTVSLEVLKGLYAKHRIHLESSGYDSDDAKVLLEDWRRACIDKGMNRPTWKRVKDSLAWNPDVVQEGSYVRILSDFDRNVA